MNCQASEYETNVLLTEQILPTVIYLPVFYNKPFQHLDFELHLILLTFLNSQLFKSIHANDSGFLYLFVFAVVLNAA